MFFIFCQYNTIQHNTICPRFEDQGPNCVYVGVVVVDITDDKPIACHGPHEDILEPCYVMIGMSRKEHWLYIVT